MQYYQFLLRLPPGLKERSLMVISMNPKYKGSLNAFFTGAIKNALWAAAMPAPPAAAMPAPAAAAPVELVTYTGEPLHFVNGVVVDNNGHRVKFVFPPTEDGEKYSNYVGRCMRHTASAFVRIMPVSQEEISADESIKRAIKTAIEANAAEQEQGITVLDAPHPPQEKS